MNYVLSKYQNKGGLSFYFNGIYYTSDVSKSPRFPEPAAKLMYNQGWQLVKDCPLDLSEFRKEWIDFVAMCNGDDLEENFIIAINYDFLQSIAEDFREVPLNIFVKLIDDVEIQLTKIERFVWAAIWKKYLFTKI
jgi:hypothetical protein